MAGAGSDTIIDSELMQFAPLIILLPMLAFPVILFLGRVFNRNPFWKDTMKEGGIIALVVMAMNYQKIPSMFYLIIDSAFFGQAGFGAIVGLAIQWGVKRGIYSNEAGQGLSLIHI